MKNNKIFISVCCDLIHSGHIRFIELASEFGPVYISIGSDRNIEFLKNRKPIYNELERKYILERIKGVEQVFIGSGIGILDFKNEFIKIHPNIFVVNVDGDTVQKQNLCKEYNCKYIVLPREPKIGLPIRSTTKIIEDIKNDTL